MGQQQTGQTNSEFNDFEVGYKLKGYEIHSPDTKQLRVSNKLIKAWNKLRHAVEDKVDNPEIVVTSGYRTKNYHRKIYKDKYGDDWQKEYTKNSKHLTGKALDVRVPDGISDNDFQTLAMECGFTYSYVIQSGVVHIDVGRR